MKKYILSNMRFYFKNQTNPFFDAINVSFEPGTLYCIQGKNGIGKSTFFSILQGTNPHNSSLTGSLQYGTDTYTINKNRIPADITAHVKTVIQDSTKMLILSMTVAENLRIAQLSKYPLPIPLNISKDMPALIKKFNIDPSMQVQLLSGGQKQILAIVMALQKQTSLLLLDEPTAALDESNSILVMDFLHTLAQKEQLIIITISHDKDMLKKYGAHNTLTIAHNHNNTRIIKQE